MLLSLWTKYGQLILADLHYDSAHSGPGAADGPVFVPASAFIGLVSLTGAGLLHYSQRWQAADLFRVTPSRGPADLCHGARPAVLLVLATLEMVLFFGAGCWLRPASPKPRPPLSRFRHAAGTDVGTDVGTDKMPRKPSKYR